MELAYTMPYTGNLINVVGMIMVYYFGRLIAIVGADGKVFYRDRNYPLYLIDYLIQQPQPSETKWN